MKISEICENVVAFVDPAKARAQSEKQKKVDKLKAIDHKSVQKRLNVLANRSKIKSVK